MASVHSLVKGPRFLTPPPPPVAVGPLFGGFLFEELAPSLGPDPQPLVPHHAAGVQVAGAGEVGALGVPGVAVVGAPSLLDQLKRMSLFVSFPGVNEMEDNDAKKRCLALPCNNPKRVIRSRKLS